VRLFVGREWDDATDWRGYNHRFTTDDQLVNAGRCLFDQDAATLFERHGAGGHLERVIELIRRGRHVGLDGYYWRRKDIRFINHRHSVVRGLNNRSHAVLSGGIRRHDRADTEYEVILDGLNLARAMSFKNVAAEIPFGGCKTTVHSDPVDLDDLQEIGFLSYAVDRSRCFTGPDMGYPPELADVMKAHFTVNITGGPKGPLGPTGTPTALGVFLAMKEAAGFRFGHDSLRERTVAIQGLGAVGLPLAEHCLEDGARLVVSEPRADLVRALQARCPARFVKVLEGEAIYFEDADVFAPCARGGIIGRERIPFLKFPIIIGGANNQLAATSQEEEFDLAAELARRGVLFQCDWWHNIGGVMAGTEEYLHQAAASPARLAARIREICPRKTRENLVAAKARGLTPTECAYRTAESLIYPQDRIG